MPDDVIKDLGDLCEYWKNAVEVKYIAAMRTIRAFSEKRFKKLAKIGLAEPKSHLEPLYFFENDSKGYTRSELEEELMHSDKTEVININ